MSEFPSLWRFPVDLRWLGVLGPEKGLELPLPSRFAPPATRPSTVEDDTVLQTMRKNRGMEAPETFLELQEMLPDEEA
jgi:hypothetical protein